MVTIKMQQFMDYWKVSWWLGIQSEMFPSNFWTCSKKTTTKQIWIRKLKKDKAGVKKLLSVNYMNWIIFNSLAHLLIWEITFSDSSTTRQLLIYLCAKQCRCLDHSQLLLNRRSGRKNGVNITFTIAIQGKR